MNTKIKFSLSFFLGMSLLLTLFSCNDNQQADNLYEEAVATSPEASLERQNAVVEKLLFQTSKVLSSMDLDATIENYQRAEQIFFEDFLADPAQRNKFETAYLSDMPAADYPQLYEAAPGQLAQAISSLLVYEEINYRLGVSIYKLTPGGNAPTIVAAPIEVDDHNAIVAFINGTERVLSEAEAKAYDGHIVITQNLDLNPVSLRQIRKMEKIDQHSVQAFNNLERMNDGMELGHYILKNPYFFERRGNIELRVVTGITARGLPTWDGDETFIKSYGVNRNTIAASHTLWPVDIVHPEVPENRFLINDTDYMIYAYEHDWYTSWKDITCSCSCANASNYNNDFQMRGKYSSEYWTKKCGILRSAWPALGTYEDMNDYNYKGFFRYWRKD